MRLLLGAMPYNIHLQQIALALWEAGWLGAYYSGGVDNWRTVWGRCLRQAIHSMAPTVDDYLARRRISTVPDGIVHHDWTWELPRAIASRLGVAVLFQDWLWERSEHQLDRRCSRMLQRDEYDGFVGVEHGSLRALVVARKSKKPAIVTFLSPHHAFRSRCLHSEFEKYPELLTRTAQRKLERGRLRDLRRDEEAKTATLIHTNSEITTQSLVESGIPREKCLTVPYGCPPAILDSDLPLRATRPARFMHAGILSVRKGGHLLLEAWKALEPGAQAELHCYGSVQLPEELLVDLPHNVFFHGSVSQAELFKAYRSSSVLVFPTLCDGFGLVGAEAMSQGLPVLTTINAGVASLIVDRCNGLLVPPGNPEALAKQLAWCLDHDDQVHDMRWAALETARKNSWGHFRDRFRMGIAHHVSRVSDAGS